MLCKFYVNALRENSPHVSSFLFLQLTWFKNGQRIRDSQRVEMSYSNQQATLRVRVALPEDSGHYTLLTENPQGCTVSSAYLAIESSDQVDQAYQTQREAIKTQQVETTGESDSGKVLPPNFVRTCTDRDTTEGKMTRYTSIISSLFLFLDSRVEKFAMSRH